MATSQPVITLETPGNRALSEVAYCTPTLVLILVSAFNPCRCGVIPHARRCIRLNITTNRRKKLHNLVWDCQCLVTVSVEELAPFITKGIAEIYTPGSYFKPCHLYESQELMDYWLHVLDKDRLVQILQGRLYHLKTAACRLEESIAVIKQLEVSDDTPYKL